MGWIKDNKINFGLRWKWKWGGPKKKVGDPEPKKGRTDDGGPEIYADNKGGEK